MTHYRRHIDGHTYGFLGAFSVLTGKYGARGFAKRMRKIYGSVRIVQSPPSMRKADPEVGKYFVYGREKYG